MYDAAKMAQEIYNETKKHCKWFIECYGHMVVYGHEGFSTLRGINGKNNYISMNVLEDVKCLINLGYRELSKQMELGVLTNKEAKFNSNVMLMVDATYRNHIQWQEDVKKHGLPIK